MAPRPIFAATHPRACSTAFERVFMARRDILECGHEPFGDAFYFGPEFLSDRFRDDADYRKNTEYCNTTFKDVLESLADAEKEGKRLFIKDMAYYLVPPDGKPSQIAPSLGGGKEPGNPTVLPVDILKRFHFTFLIRHPKRSIPSYYRCTIPPLSEITGFDYFMPNEAGYVELVRLLDFLLERGIVDRDHITAIDADDLLDKPEPIIREYCARIGIDFKPEMLKWTEEDREYAAQMFAKWNGFHDDALKNSCFQARSHAQKTSTIESENKEWADKYGPEAQKVIRQTVDDNIPHYEYLKQFCITV
ncbi:P-loop containing nucleoside triphosphate hydrolase protein [Trichoderma sp. SZMC 28011]